MSKSIASFCAAFALLALGCGGGEDRADAESGEISEVSAGAPAQGDAVQRCLELAAKRSWGDALIPCEEASRKLPDDMRIKHALQQARAAAEG